MECSCMVEIDSWDISTPEFYNEKLIIARKQHSCCACGYEIQKGEKYEYVSMKQDGDFGTYKTCESCLAVRDLFFCNGWYFETLWENLEQSIADSFDGEDMPWAEIGNLPKRARDRVCDFIEECWEE